MSKQVYNWKRFWCPRSDHIDLADGGYLPEPTSDLGRAYNPKLVSFDEISSLPCLVLLGEAGMGKTEALEAAHNQTDMQTKDSEDVCLPLFRLGDYGSDTDLCGTIFRNNTFQTWLAGTHKLYLFLDSLDEGLISIKILVRILKREITNLPCDRLYFRLTCRAAEWASSLEEKLIEKWGEDNFGVYTLAPLRHQDLIEAANKNNIIDVESFLQAIWERNAVPLAIKPITLQFLIDIYGKESKLPSSQIELYRKGCLQLCEEVNPDRREAGEKGNLSSKQRMRIAGRIAAVMIFGKQSAVWISPEYGKKRDSDLAIQDLCIGREKIDSQEFDIDENSIREVFKVTGLFSVQDCNQRIGFSHRTYAEFLAAWYLNQHNLDLSKILSLIAHPDGRIIPQLRETTAWLASMRPDVFQWVMETDTDVLLQSDVPTDVGIRTSIVDNLLTQYEEGKLCDRGGNNYHNYGKLKHPGLANQLRPYICDASKQIDTRELAIDIANVCEVSELQEELAALALDPSQSIHLRANAVRTISSVGDETTKLKLKPLAIEQLPEDEDDQLKGYALQALWPNHLTAEELFPALTPPQQQMFLGGYWQFLNYKLASQLWPDDLVVALNWLEQQGLRCFGHPFEELGDGILFKAWENFDLPGVAESFTQVALVQWRKHRRIITHDDRELQEQFASSLFHDSRKRRTLIEQAVWSITRTEEDPFFLVSSLTEDVLVSEDIYWMLEKLQSSDCEKVQRIWVQLIQQKFDRQNVEQINAIIVATQTNSILQKAFATYFAAIELDSSQADKLRADHLRMQERIDRRQKPPLLDPPPQERMLQLLEKLEAGDLSAWWQLNRVMTLKPESQHYSNKFELDLTQLPGWQEADTATRRRIIEGAKTYIQQQDDVDYGWIGTNTFNRPAMAGCRALMLLKEDRAFLTTLSLEIWKRWTPVIMAVHESNPKDIYLELVKVAYLNASQEAINTLRILIEPEHASISTILRRFDKCWDRQLTLFLLEKVKDLSLKPEQTGELLTALLERGSDEARGFAQSLIVDPLPAEGNERQISVIAAGTLIENVDSSSWSLIWPFIQRDPSFGREVFERAADLYSRKLDLNLTETQLAELYVWLVRQYPYREDPDYSNPEDTLVTPRKRMVDLKRFVLTQLTQRGTPQACAEIQRLVQELPDLIWLKKILIDAQTNMRRNTWRPPQPGEILQLILNQEKRLVQSGYQLLEVLIESLKRLELELQGETPAVRDVWDRDKVNDKVFKPIDENAFSDYVKRFLDRDLKSRGIIVNREVELRRSYGGNPGERTDIHVNAVLKHPNGEAYDSITAIIEVKGCWHDELLTAMQNQLVERYLADNAYPYGLYLVGWFDCHQWSDEDLRKKRMPKISLDEARKQFADQAEKLRSSPRIVRSYVLNTALR